MEKETSVLKKQFSEDKKSKKTAHAYINNPFMITVKGLEWMFNRAKSISILLLILSLLGAVGNYGFRSMQPTNFDQDQQQLTEEQTKVFNNFTHAVQSITLEQWLGIGVLVLLVLLVVLFIGFWLKGAADFAAAQLAKGKTITIRQALGGSWRRLGSYAWVQIIVGVKVFLWSLLLVVPGIIMAVRYSLAGTAFFAEDDLKGNAAVKRSLALTKNAWTTTFATLGLFNLVTLGLVSSLVDIANNSVLYRQFADAGETKPAAHWLSKLILTLAIIFLVFMVAGAAILAAAGITYVQNH